MKNVLSLAAILALSVPLYAQKGSAHINIFGGGSTPIGLYGTTDFIRADYADALYPFEGGGAFGGFNFGLSGSYFFHKNIGVSLDWNYSMHDLWFTPRADGIEDFWGPELVSYTNVYEEWVHNTITAGAVVAIPLMDDRLVIDARAQVGLNTYSVPIIEDIIDLTGGASDYYISGGEVYTAFATNFGLGARYYFGNFGVGFNLSAITAFTAGNDTFVENIYDDGLVEEVTTSFYANNYDVSMINYVAMLSYRLGGK